MKRKKNKMPDRLEETLKVLNSTINEKFHETPCKHLEVHREQALSTNRDLTETQNIINSAIIERNAKIKSVEDRQNAQETSIASSFTALGARLDKKGDDYTKLFARVEVQEVQMKSENEKQNLHSAQENEKLKNEIEKLKLQNKWFISIVSFIFFAGAWYLENYKGG